MAVTANSLVTPQGVVSNAVVCTAAKTTHNDTTNAIRLIAAATVPNGALIKKLHAMPRDTVSANMNLQVYRSYDSGTTLYLADSALMNAYTKAATTAVPKTDFGLSADFPARLKPNEELWVAIGSALTAGVVFVVEYEAF